MGAAASGARGEPRSLLRANARRMYFSAEAIDGFLADAPLAQVRAVNELMGRELALRGARRRERMMRRARFPQARSFAGLDCPKVTMPEGHAPPDLESLGFVDRTEGFVFHGETGRGKSHLAIATGIAAAGAGIETRLFGTASLAMMLDEALQEGGLDERLRDISKARLVALDEFGYVPITVGGSRALFQVVSDCYERRSLVITTNIESGKWGTVLGDDKLAAAMIDRMARHNRLVEFNGASHRMEETLMLGKGKRL